MCGFDPDRLVDLEIDQRVHEPASIIPVVDGLPRRLYVQLLYVNEKFTNG